MLEKVGGPCNKWTKNTFRCKHSGLILQTQWVCLAVCLTQIAGDLPPYSHFDSLGRLCPLTLECLHFFLPVSLLSPSDGSFKALCPGCLCFIHPQGWEEWRQQFSPGVQRWPQGTPNVFSGKAGAWEEMKGTRWLTVEAPLLFAKSGGTNLRCWIS